MATIKLNLDDQVQKNKDDIQWIKEYEGTLNQFGLRIIEEVEYNDAPPSGTAAEGTFYVKRTAVGGTYSYTIYIYGTYLELEGWYANGTVGFSAIFKAKYVSPITELETWEYGDTVAVKLPNGSGDADDQHYLFTFTRASGTHLYDYMFNIGTFPMAGPKGDTGAQGPTGETGATGATGADGTDGTCIYPTKTITELKPIATVINVANIDVPANQELKVGDIIIGPITTYSGIEAQFMFTITSIGVSTANISVISNHYIQRGPQGETGPQGSIVEASATGTSTTEAGYITIDDVEYKLVAAASIYTAGTGIDITNNVVSADTDVLATQDYVDQAVTGLVATSEMEDYAVPLMTPTSIYDAVYASDMSGEAKLINISNVDIASNSIVQRTSTGQIICNTPSSGDDAVNKTYVDDEVGGLATTVVQRYTVQTTAPSAAILDGGIHIVVLSSEPATKYNGYIYLISEA